MLPHVLPHALPVEHVNHISNVCRYNACWLANALPDLALALTSIARTPAEDMLKSAMAQKGGATSGTKVW